MKKYKLNFLLAAVFAGVGFMTSCNNEPLTYESGNGGSGSGIFFAENTDTQVTLDADGGSFTVYVNRGVKGEELTVPVTVDFPENTKVDLSSTFSYPSSVTFKADETSVPFVIEYVPFDESEMDYDTYESLLLSIPSEYHSSYGTGLTDVEISCVYPSPWRSLGKGTFTDEGWWISDDDDTIEVEFFQNELDENLFRVTNPYVAFTGENTYFQFRVLQKDEVYMDQVVPETGLVAYPDFKIDYYPDEDADVYLVFPGRFPNFADPSNWVYNYVVDFQDNGLPGEIKISPYYYMFGVGGWNYTTLEPITMLFPGYEALDTEVAVVYNGMLNKPDNSMEAVAYVDLGKDVTKAKVALVPGSYPTDAITGIQDGSIESQTITSSSQVNITFDPNNAEGNYSIVAVSYYGDEARGYDFTTFKYVPANSATWSLVATGEYTYLDFWANNLGLEPEVLELYQSDADPGKFKIEHWFNDVDFAFTVDASGNIMVAEQETGFVNGGAMIFVDDLVDYTGGDKYGTSYLKDGVYNFAVIYFDSEGVFTYGNETFVPAAAGSKAKKVNKTKALKNKKGHNLKHITGRIPNIITRGAIKMQNPLR